jgi:TM2 domain-containing membrane protein YozV
MKNNKLKLTSGLLAIFLGGFGVHKFYLGKIFQGILHLIFFWTFIPSMIGYIEGLVYLGISNSSFDKKYNSSKKVDDKDNKNSTKLAFWIFMSFLIFVFLVGISANMNNEKLGKSSFSNFSKLNNNYEKEPLNLSEVKNSVIEDFNHRDFQRNPENYIGKYIKLEGMIFQKFNDKSSLFKKKFLSDYTYYLTYPNIDKLLEDDRVLVYGIITERIEYETRIGKELAPRIKVLEITIKSENLTYTFDTNY